MQSTVPVGWYFFTPSVVEIPVKEEVFVYLKYSPNLPNLWFTFPDSTISSTHNVLYEAGIQPQLTQSVVPLSWQYHQFYTQCPVWGRDPALTYPICDFPFLTVLHTMSCLRQGYSPNLPNMWFPFPDSAISSTYNVLSKAEIQPQLTQSVVPLSWQYHQFYTQCPV